MSARNEILDALRISRPPHVVLPEPPLASSEVVDLVEEFSGRLEAIGGSCHLAATKAELRDVVARELQGHERFATLVPGLRLDAETIPASTSVLEDDAKTRLGSMEVAVVQAQLGVAENGAVWLDEDDIGHRVLPVIVESLVVVLSASAILPTMHEAYEHLGARAFRFGQFVAGPSKTADIEQSLVIGAHGAKKMTVVITTQKKDAPRGIR